MEVLGRWAATKTVEELFREGQERRFPWAGVYDIAQVLTVPQLRDRGFWTEVEHPELGTRVTYPGAPYKLSATPWAISRRPPHHDEHTNEVLRELSG
jgi:crotonobetainyl-CoA:carnitine CoA-transferase CaiB-like acyl-CoA transferase